MHSKRLDQAQQLSIDLLDAVHWGDSVDKLIERFPNAEVAFKYLADSDESTFAPMVMTFDAEDNIEKIFISSITDKDEFLIDSLTVISVMDASSVILCLDAYIKLNVDDVDTGGLTLEQMHALGEAHTCISLLSFDLEQGLHARYIPYESTGSGVDTLDDKIVETDNDGFKSMDKGFQIMFEGMKSLLGEPIMKRINEFWSEFIANEKASASFFKDDDTPQAREDAISAFKYLMSVEDGRRYVQCIIEDSLLSASELGVLQRPQQVKDTLSEIDVEVNTETEIGKCLIKARLTS